MVSVFPHSQKSAKCDKSIKVLNPVWLPRRNISLEYGMELHGVEMALYIYRIQMEKFLYLPSIHLNPSGCKEAN